MMGIMNAVNARALSIRYGMQNFFANEVKRIKEDESGMELIQVILIILMVVVIAAALWAFLGEWITNLLKDVFDKSEPVGDDPGMNPFG